MYIFARDPLLNSDTNVLGAALGGTTIKFNVVLPDSKYRKVRYARMQEWHLLLT